MAVEDIRLCVDALDHPKLVALEERLGELAPFRLIRLWCFAGRYHKDGKLAGMDPKLIAIAAKWPKDRAAEFVNTLVDLRLLDHKDGVYRVHDWKEIQPWIFHSEKRSAAARKAVNHRWGKRLKGHTERIRNVSKPYRKRTASAHTPSPDPIPSPTPDPNPKPVDQKQHRPRKGRGPVREYPPGFVRFWQAYPRKEAKDTAAEYWERFRLEPHTDAIVAAVEAQKGWPADTGLNKKTGPGRDNPHPGTWLKSGRWKDEGSEDPVLWEPPDDDPPMKAAGAAQ